MSDDKYERLNAIKEKLDARERELRQSLQREVGRQAERDAAITLAARVAMFGSIPSILWTIPSVRWTIASNFQKEWSGGFEFFLTGQFYFVIPIAIMAAAAGVVSGWFAAWWFADSMIPVPRAAICLALISDAVMFGWVIALS